MLEGCFSFKILSLSQKAKVHLVLLLEVIHLMN